MSEKNLNETAAMDSLKPTPNGSSRAAMMAQAMMAFSNMSVEDLSHFLNDSLAQVGKEAQHVPDANAAKNKASVNMKEDINEMFGEDLSEELKNKATTLFEAHVAQRVALEVAHLQDQFATQLTESVDAGLESVVENLNKYVQYAADLYMTENELAIENGLKLEIAEEMMHKIKNVFVESYIDIPESKVDVLEVMTSKVSELEDKVNDVVAQNIELMAALIDKERDSVFEEFKTGLTVTQIEKFKNLAEGLTYNTVDELKKKLSTLKEATFNIKTEKTGIIKEESDVTEIDDKGNSMFDDTKKPSAPKMKSYLDALAKNNSTRI